jgi:hypothetical protein
MGWGRKKQAKQLDIEQGTPYHLTSMAYVMTEILFVPKGLISASQSIL